MTNRVQTLRSSVAGNVPTSGTRQPGELWVNFADKQIGYIDASQVAQKAQAVRFFSSSATYAPGDCVWNGGALYAANVAVSAGAFNSSQWTLIGGQNIGYLPISGGTLTGPLTISSGALTVAAAGGTFQGLISAQGASAMHASYDRGSSGGNTANAFAIYRDANIGRVWMQEAADVLSFTTAGAASFAQTVTGSKSISTSVGITSMPQFVANVWGQFGSTTGGQAYCSMNAYNEATTGIWKIGATHASLGYGIIYAGSNGAFWGGAAGAVTAGQAVTPSMNKLWSQADGTPLWNSGTQTLTGTLVINAPSGVYYPIQMSQTTAGYHCAVQMTVPSRSWLNGPFSDGTFHIYDNTAGVDRFNISATGGATFTGSLTVASGGTGQLLIGASGAWEVTSAIQVSPQSSGAGSGGCISTYCAAASAVGHRGRVDIATAYLAFYQWGASTNVGSITTNGSTTSYNTGCDARLKENVQRLALEVDVGRIIDEIEPVAFHWKAKKSKTPAGEEISLPAFRDFGFLAQDLHRVLPHVVTPGQEIEGHPEFAVWGADYSKIVPYLVAELQLLRQRVAQLEGTH